jgi:hypothetical protein
LEKIEEERRGFNNELDTYHRDGCDDDDNDFRGLRNTGSRLARTPLPQPQLRYGPRNAPEGYFGREVSDALRVSAPTTGQAAAFAGLAAVLLTLSEAIAGGL